MSYSHAGRGYSKPAPGARVKWSSPLALGLQIAIPVNEGAGQSLCDVAGNRLWTPNVLNNSDLSWKASPVGMTRRDNDPASTWYWGPSIQLNHVRTRFSFAIRVLLDSVTSAQAVYNGIASGIVVRCNSSSKIELAQGGTTAASTSSLTAGRYHTWGVTYDGSTARFYLDGKPAGTASASMTFSNENIPAIGFNNLVFLYAWDRVLSAPEMEAINTEPYQILTRGVARRFFDTTDETIYPGGIASTVAFGTPTLVGSIRPGGIASTVAFGTARLVDAIIPSGIASTVAFGTPEIASEVSLQAAGIPSTLRFGTPALLPETDRAFSVFANGADVTKYIKDPSIHITLQINSRGTCEFEVIPEISRNAVASSWTPAMYDQIVIHHNESGYRLFLGEVESVAKTIPSGGLAGGGYFHLHVRCTDFGVILDRRVMAKWYTVALGSYVPIIARDIVDNFLDGTGIEYDGVVPPTGSYIGEQLANWVYVGEFLRQICDEANLAFRIDNYKALRLIDRSTGYESAPFAIEQNNGLWRSMTSTQTRGKFANRIIVRNSQDISALWTDTAECNGSAIYATTYPQSVKPIITVDDVEQIVCEADERGATAGWQWYYIQDGIGVFPQTDPGSGTLVIRYPSRVSHVAIAEDTDSIATYGQWDHIEEVKDLTDPDVLQQHAEALLASLGTIPLTLAIETESAGLEPGQLLDVDANGVDGSFLIEQTDINEYYNSKVRWNVTASNAPQRNGAGGDFFRKLVSKQRQAVDRIESGVAFVLAETIEGSENPGLSVGVKNAVRVARKTGYAKMAYLWFNSVVESSPATLTSETIEIDMLQNGVSIFGGSYKMLFPAGATSVQTSFFFRENPLRVEAGDVFTIQVIRADSAATDGWFELQVQG